MRTEISLNKFLSKKSCEIKIRKKNEWTIVSITRTAIEWNGIGRTMIIEAIANGSYRKTSLDPDNGLWTSN